MLYLDVCLLHKFLELGMKMCRLYFVCWKLRCLVFIISNCKESLATCSLLVILLANMSLFVAQISTKSLIVCVPTLRGYGYVDKRVGNCFVHCNKTFLKIHFWFFVSLICVLQICILHVDTAYNSKDGT